MTSKKIIERLQQQDWFVSCETEHELALVLNACLDAEINWTNGAPASFLPDQILQKPPVFIGRNAKFDESGLFWADLMYFDAEPPNLEDITDWFFEELRNEHEHNTD